MALDYDSLLGPTLRDSHGRAASQKTEQSRLSASRDGANDNAATAVGPSSGKAGRESAGAAEFPTLRARASKLHETFAALAQTPQRTAEQIRAAFAEAAKTQPMQTRDRDYGAER